MLFQSLSSDILLFFGDNSTQTNGQYQEPHLYRVHRTHVVTCLKSGNCGQRQRDGAILRSSFTSLAVSLEEVAFARVVAVDESSCGR